MVDGLDSMKKKYKAPKTRKTGNNEIIKILKEKEAHSKIKLSEKETEEILDNQWRYSKKIKSIIKDIDSYEQTPELAIFLAKLGVLKELFDNYTDELWIENYPTFWISEEELKFLYDMSNKISKKKEHNHSTFELEDEIDEYFNKKVA